MRTESNTIRVLKKLNNSPRYVQELEAELNITKYQISEALYSLRKQHGLKVVKTGNLITLHSSTLKLKVKKGRLISNVNNKNKITGGMPFQVVMGGFWSILLYKITRIFK